MRRFPLASVNRRARCRRAPAGHGVVLLADLRFEDILFGFERLRGFEVIDFPPALLEPLVEGVLRGGELLQGGARIVALLVDDGHIPLRQALEPHLLLAYAQTPTGRLVLAATRGLDLIEDGSGLISFAGLDKLRKAIHRHGLFPLVLVILTDDYSNRYGGDVYPYMRTYQ
jgi:hypothetical protein